MKSLFTVMTALAAILPFTSAQGQILTVPTTTGNNGASQPCPVVTSTASVCSTCQVAQCATQSIVVMSCGCASKGKLETVWKTYECGGAGACAVGCLTDYVVMTLTDGCPPDTTLPGTGSTTTTTGTGSSSTGTTSGSGGGGSTSGTSTGNRTSTTGPSTTSSGSGTGGGTGTGTGSSSSSATSSQSTAGAGRSGEGVLIPVLAGWAVAWGL